MTLSRVTRSICIAGSLAAIGAVASTVGAILILVAGVASLAVVSRRTSSGSSEMTEFLPWLLCLFAFATVTLMMSPFVQVPAATISMCLLTPLFGTIAYIVERALVQPNSRVD